jgi:hypothetical protein
MDTKAQDTQQRPLRAPYEPPAITIIGPVREFTFGSMFSSNDAGTQHGGHHT